MTVSLTLGAVLAFNAALLLAILSPGPSLLFLTRQTLTNGRRAGVLTALGLALMAALWTLAALLGVQTLFTLFPWAYAAMKLAGALYLIWLAVQMWRNAARPLTRQSKPVADRRSFLSGMLVNLANPKSVFFAAAVIVVIFPAELSAADKALIFANHLAIELIVQPALALLLGTPLVRTRYLTLKPLFDRAAGTILGVLGLRLLLEK
ncbi:LysE family translocator [Sulfitobacter aestuariivivens]|uniref:LysE family transporter n=1 Tax=Sulfitobacter aestuariivivens TaxID=2766981 RepID=A0A927D4V2_9RHOB|nr:LysE family transporter [Sulfitobacter aestuariivivens]MBD3663467.1 LysE family transporter [Sulfitobacter aestuariivivens]